MVQRWSFVLFVDGIRKYSLSSSWLFYNGKDLLLPSPETAGTRSVSGAVCGIFRSISDFRDTLYGVIGRAGLGFLDLVHPCDVLVNFETLWPIFCLSDHNRMSRRYEDVRGCSLARSTIVVNALQPTKPWFPNPNTDDDDPRADVDAACTKIWLSTTMELIRSN